MIAMAVRFDRGVNPLGNALAPALATWGLVVSESFAEPNWDVFQSST